MRDVVIKEACLSVSGLTKRFGGLVAVKDIGFRIMPGEILGLIGPNGSGKSTVMKLIMGIIKPNAGSILLEGIDVAGWPSHRIARAGVGIVFQHSRPLHRQTVLENIKLGLLPDSLLRLLHDREVERKAREIAARVELDHVLDRYPSTLPFADLRRMELAKAIARDPKLVLVDEPFAGLTAQEVRSFSALIEGFRDEGRAVLLVDHNVKSVSAMADRVLAMYLGEYVAEGTAEEVMRNETVRRVYLGGAIEIAARPALSQKSGPPLLEVADVSVLYGKAQALDKVSLHVKEGEFVSVVGLNGAGKTTFFNAISGLVPYSGTIKWAGDSLAGRSAGSVARGGIVQCAETRRIVRRHERARESRSRRLASAARGERGTARMAVRPVPDFAQPPGAGGQNPLGRRAADAGDRPRLDDEAETSGAGRTHARPGAGDFGADLQGAGIAAQHHADHRAAR